MILFLDFDGVLHPDAVYMERGRPVLRDEGTLFMWLPYLEEVLDLHREVGIVISSSWCRVLGFNRARKYLSPALRTKVIGATWHSSMGRTKLGGFKTPHTWWDSATRYEQIMRYVCRARLEDWVAIDDNCEGWPEVDANKLVLTDSRRGISEPRVISILNERLASR